MIEPAHPDLTIREQCRLVGLSPSSYYYQAHPPDPTDAEVMGLIDRIFTEYPCYGVERVGIELERKGLRIGPKRVRTLMRRMELFPVYPKPRLSLPGVPSRKYPYLLGGLDINHPDQVWATDITWIRLGSGFGFLCAILDIYSRYILAWALSNTQEAQFCISVLEAALATGRKPEIFNNDQGSQFTCADFVDRLLHREIRPSWDGKGRWVDNVFVERFWRTVKYECVFLHDWPNVRAARSGLGDFMPYYNQVRPHTALNNQTPAVYYFKHPQSKPAEGCVNSRSTPLSGFKPEQGTP
jgi:putative transposase